MMCWLQQWRRNQFSSARKTIKRDNNKKKPSPTGLLWMHIESPPQCSWARARKTWDDVVEDHRRKMERRRKSKQQQTEGSVSVYFLRMSNEKGMRMRMSKSRRERQRAETWNKNWKDDEEKIEEEGKQGILFRLSRKGDRNDLAAISWLESIMSFELDFSQTLNTHTRLFFFVYMSLALWDTMIGVDHFEHASHWWKLTNWTWLETKFLQTWLTNNRADGHKFLLII